MHDERGCKLKSMWLYMGIIMTCSGIGTGFGIFLIILYFWDDIKNAIKESQVEYKNQTEYKNKTEYKNQKPSDPLDPKFYDRDTAEEMR